MDFASSETTFAKLEAMRRREEDVYNCQDYFHQQQIEEAENPAIGPLSRGCVSVDSRYKMVEWCYKVVDFCRFSRETASIAMSILDRFLATPQGRPVLHNREEFQLAAMTSLYTAVKIHEPEVMSAQLVSQLSRGANTEKQVIDMEMRVLQSIHWQVNPPTSLAFVRELSSLLPEALMNEQTKATVYEVSKFQTELAVSDYSLITVPASTIGYVALMNAIDTVCMDKNIFNYVSSILAQAAHINLYAPGLDHVQIQLCEAVLRHTQPTGKKFRPVNLVSHQQPQHHAAPHHHHHHQQHLHQSAQTPQAKERLGSYKASPCGVNCMEV